MDLEGLPWCAGRQGGPRASGRYERIQRAYHGMMEGRGGSRWFTMVCWKCRQDLIQIVYHGVPEGRGGS